MSDVAISLTGTRNRRDGGLTSIIRSLSFARDSEYANFTGVKRGRAARATNKLPYVPAGGAGGSPAYARQRMLYERNLLVKLGRPMVSI